MSDHDMATGLTIFFVIAVMFWLGPGFLQDYRKWRSRRSGRQAYLPRGVSGPAQVPAPASSQPAGPDILRFGEFWKLVTTRIIHLALLGPSGAGKTRFAVTLYRHILSRPDSQVLVIASKSRNIWGLRPIGIPEQPGDPVRYEEIVAALRALTKEMRRRQSWLFHDPDFDHNISEVWVFIDEELDLATNSITSGEYATFTQVFSSLARELRMHFVKMNQDKTVGATATPGMGGLRENLTLIKIDRDTHVITMHLDQREYRLEDTRWLTTWEPVAPDSVPLEKIFELDMASPKPTEVAEIEIVNECPAGHLLDEGQMKAYRCPVCEKEGLVYSGGKSPGRFNKQMVREAQLRRGLTRSLAEEQERDVQMHASLSNV